MYTNIGSSNEEGEIYGSGVEVRPDILSLRTLIVNAIFCGAHGSDEWVLVDTGVSPSSSKVYEVATDRFPNQPPKAIVLTHGHFDHVGGLDYLLRQWEDVPVYAHEDEMPYLTGKADYKTGDSSVGGGLMATISPFYSNKGIDLGDRVKTLPQDGSIPGMPGWRWIHTPGHTPGHVAFFRDSDRALIVGDAFATVKQESLMAVLSQKKEIHGPPSYFTTDWDAAWNSVQRLADLRPQYAIPGHGLPMEGEELQLGLERLAREFDKIAVPPQERKFLTREEKGIKKST